MLKNLKMRTKLVVSFGLVVILLLIIALTSAYSLATVDEQTNLYAVYTVPNAHTVWQVRRDMVSAQRYLLCAMNSKTKPETTYNLDHCQKDIASIEEGLLEYRQNGRGDVQEVETVIEYFNENKEMLDRMGTLLKEDTDGSKLQAVSVYEGKFEPNFNRMADAIS
ncbi:MAG: MCP four helix bundle domain-containing protein, partial [Acetanaerobacterium sp.]